MFRIYPPIILQAIIMFKKHSKAFFLKHLRLPTGFDSQFMVSGEGKSKTVPGFTLRLWEFR